MKVPDEPDRNEGRSGGGLRDADPMFHLLFERTADAVLLFDPSTATVLDCNEAAAALMRCDHRADLVGKRAEEISADVQPDGSPTTKSVASRIAETFKNGNCRFEWTWRRVDGTDIPLEVNATAIERDGKPVFVLVSRDLSERKEAEAALLRAAEREISDHKRAESEIRTLNASLERRVAERTTELLRANDQLRQAEEKLRKSSEQVQKHRDVLLELAHADKSDFAKALSKICIVSAATLQVARVGYWSLRENGSVIVCEMLYVRDAGQFDEPFNGTSLAASRCPDYFQALAARRPLVADVASRNWATKGLTEMYLQPLGISSMLDAPVWVRGEVVGVLCHEHTGPPREWSPEEVDFVSALAATVSLALEESKRAKSEHLLRESEEKFRALFEGTSQAVSLHDENGILEANPNWLRLFGYSRLDEVLGKHPAELSAPIQVGGASADALARKHIADALAYGSARFDWVILRRDGAELPIEVFLTRIQLGGRQLIQAVCNDITQRKHAEAELVRALAREKELGQLRSNFVSMVSHEFRTPLGIIQSSAEILEDYLEQLKPAERDEHLRSIRKSTRRMADLMEEVLLLGSFDAGRMEFKPGLLNLRSFVTRIIDEVRSATNRRCPIDLFLGETPADIQADERLLQHIFTNLLTNAVKYSEPEQAVRVEIEIAEERLACSVRDQGIGIPETDREWLFNAFYRGHNVGDQPGTGLGLVIVKRCVDLHGGKIKVDSKSGEGTTVTVTLPI
ncbi:MAG TPA: ATP-binding protein [Terrimicrobiaceae bacterium]|nr:ATP-binding protein [Terrimicrobiaceae bacterium]